MANKTRMRLFLKYIARTFGSVVVLAVIIGAALIALLGPMALADYTNNAAFLLIYVGYVVTGVVIEAWIRSGEPQPPKMR